MKLKTLKDFERKSTDDYELGKCWAYTALREEAIKLIKNLQGPDSIYPNILELVPEDSKGEIAKDKWNDTMFKYGSEYGMIAMLIYFFNITKDDIGCKEVDKHPDRLKYIHTTGEMKNYIEFICPGCGRKVELESELQCCILAVFCEACKTRIDLSECIKKVKK